MKPMNGKTAPTSSSDCSPEPTLRNVTCETRPSRPDKATAWLLNQRAKELATAGKQSEADAAYAEALAALERDAELRGAAQLLQDWGKRFARQGAWNAAVERYQQALAIERKVAPKGLAEARILDSWGIVEAKRGDIELSLGQCAAQMVGARLFNKKAGRPGTVPHHGAAPGTARRHRAAAGR